jgi:hypothetical protein
VVGQRTLAKAFFNLAPLPLILKRFLLTSPPVNPPINAHGTAVARRVSAALFFHFLFSSLVKYLAR